MELDGEQDAPPAPITERLNSPVQQKNIFLSCEHDVWGAEASPFPASLSDFESSSGNGCFDCKMILKAIYEFNPSWVQEGRSSNPPSASVRLRFIQDSIYVVLLDGHDEVGSFRLSRNLKEGTSVIPTDITRNKIRYSISDLACNPLFQTTIDRAKDILSTCNKEHEGCQRGNLAFTPRRLLHVDLANESRQVFLFEPTKPVQYVALSYCWGPEAEVRDVLRTTSYNIESHRQKLPFALVPQTIRDAMTVCWKLGIQYIWVDSLCIIQDDEDDWSCEAAKMLDVYANSYFSIAVREPDCCKLGFLGQQSHKDPEPEGDNLEEKICSLDKRAWCFQEGAVPTRILYFTHNQVGWGCFQTSGGGNVLGETGVRLKTALGRGYSQDVNCGPFSQVREWIEVVEKYSNRQLSRETDKLPAISGLASLILEANQLGNFKPPSRQYTYFSKADKIDRKQFRDLPETSPDVYLAGLWRNYFVVGLAWNVKKNNSRQYDNEHHNQTGDYIAPSWSWASVQGPVRYRCIDGVKSWKYSPRLRKHVEIGQVEVKFPPTQTSNLTGQVVSGFAILTGPLAEVQLTVLDSELSSLWKSSIGTRSPAGNRQELSVKENIAIVCGIEHSRTFRVELDISMKPTPESHIVSPVNCVIYELLRSRCIILWNTVESKREGPRYFCIQLFTWHANGSGGRNMPPETWFLLLEEIKSDTYFGERTYKRIGIGTWDARENSGGVGEDEEDCGLFADCVRKTIKIV